MAAILFYTIMIGMFTGTGLLLNSTLVPIIILFSSQGIGSYKYLLLCYTLSAILYGLVTITTLPAFAPSKRGWMMISTTDFLPRQASTFCLESFCGTYVQIYTILMYSFIYRYAIICRPKIMLWFKQPRRIAVLVVIFIALFCYIGFYGSSFAAPTVEKTLLMRQWVLEHLDVNLNDVGYLALLIQEDGHYGKEIVFVLGMWTTFKIIISTVVIFCIVKVMKEFKKLTINATISGQSKKLQMQLFLLLILQTAVPVMFSFVPAFVTYGCGVFGVEVPKLARLCSCLLPLAQLLDPILIFFLIGDYRNAVFRMLGFRHNAMPVSQGTATILSQMEASMAM